MALRERRAEDSQARICMWGRRAPDGKSAPFLPSPEARRCPTPWKSSHHSAENQGNTERYRSGTCARALRAKSHRQGNSNRRAVAPGLCSWKSEIRVSAGLVPSKGSEGTCILVFAPLCWLFLVFAANLPHFLVCSSIHQISAFIFTWHSVCVHVRTHTCVQISPLYS